MKVLLLIFAELNICLGSANLGIAAGGDLHHLPVGLGGIVLGVILFRQYRKRL